MADNFLGSTCDVLGIKYNRRPSDLLIWLTMTGQPSWDDGQPLAVRSCLLRSTDPERCIPGQPI